MTKGIWTHKYVSDRFVDKFAKWSWHAGLIKTYGYDPIMGRDGKEIGAHVRIAGNRLLVKLIDKFSEPRLSAEGRKEMQTMLRSIKGRS